MSAFHPPESGELRRRVTFQARSVGQDSAGGLLATWYDAFTVYAKIDPLSGRELLAAQVVHAETTHEVWVRYRAELANPATATRYRITLGTRVFNILGALDLEERRQWIVCQCSEGLIDQESQP